MAVVAVWEMIEKNKLIKELKELKETDAEQGMRQNVKVMNGTIDKCIEVVEKQPVASMIHND